MDHDDNDFQSQNFQLASEDNNKFSSGFRPFALPKLDIDDQHLRFDTLVDSEVFFSVQGHTSSWIEALSTGSNIVDFSSSAAESCSVSKTNNVWSEATSTESVEMMLKSVGESEMTGNIDGNAHNQLSGMDSQIDPSNEQLKSSNSPTDSTVVPTEKDQSQNTCSGMTGIPEHSQNTRSRIPDGPSSTQSQPEHFVPFSIDEKGIVSEQMSSSHKTSESCPAAGSYFEAVRDDHSLGRLNMPSAELDSGKLNNETFPELAPLQNIYHVTDSYHFEHANQESEAGVPQDSNICHISENKVEDGLHDLPNLSSTGPDLGAVNLSSQMSNETLLPGSSDGLLEAITNPVKMLQRNDDTCKAVGGTPQTSFSPVQGIAEGLKSSVDMSNKIVDNEFDIASNSTLSHQSETNLRNSHHNTSTSIESSKMSLSPNRKLDHGTAIPEETKNTGANSAIIFNDDESKHELLRDHQGSVENPKIGAVEENKFREEEEEEDITAVSGNIENPKIGAVEEKKFREEEDITAVSGNIEKMVPGDHEENATGATYTSNDKCGSLDTISPDAAHTSENPYTPSVNHEESFKEGDVPPLEGPENTHLILTDAGPQEKISVPSISSSSHMISTTVTDPSSNLKDRNDCSGDVSLADASAVPPSVQDSIMSTVNQESLKGDAKSALEDEDDNIISPDSEPGPEISKVPMNQNTDAVCSGAESVDKKDKEHVISIGGLTTGENQDKSGNQDVHSEKCQTGGSLIQSDTPSTLASSESTVENLVGTPLNGRDDLNGHVQDTVLNHGTDCSAGSVLSQGKLDSSGDQIGADATCGPSMICTEHCPPKGGHANSILPHPTVVEQPENMTDNEASSDDTLELKQCSDSNRNVESTVASEETNTAADDRSFSFEVGAPTNVSEKAHSPAWSPFPRFNASQIAEVTKENPQPKSSGKSLNDSSDDNKKTSDAEPNKEQLPERKVTESSAGPSDKSKSSDSTKILPLEPSQQHATPECSDLGNLPFTDSQHVQLRAQIFVYGALIQGTPPGEAYMTAAFGEPVGGGKPTWEAAWRAALERFQYQKSIYNGLETPTSSRLGSVSEKATKGTAVKTAPASKKGGKTVLPAHSSVTLQSPAAPPSSSTFNLQRGTLDFSQAISPAFAYNSHVRHPSPGVASWYPQSPSPRSAPWLVQPQNLIFDSSTQPAVPANETSKGPASKSISVSNAVSPGVFAPSPAPPVVSPLAVIQEEKRTAPTSTSKGTSSQKPRKRKKASASPEQQPVVASPQLTDMMSFTPAAKHASGFTLSTHSPSNALASRLVPNLGQTSVPSYQITGNMDAEQSIMFPEQICGAIEQSVGQAKGANLHSTEAVRHKESVWGHLSTISRNKIPPEVEEKLTSAAAAAEAAVSVAKAAAEAAKMASEAALQAKIMAEEALNSSKPVNSLQIVEAGEFKANINPPSLLSSSPVSSWKIKDNNHAPGSIVSVAREVARKRVEEASAAAKRAENLDAILKAAELAAEAVFNAGTIIGMGEPLPFTLSELLEAGPDGFWKSERLRNIKAASGNGNILTETLQVDVPGGSNKPAKKRGRKPKSDQSVLNSEPSSSARELQLGGMQSDNGVNDVPVTASGDGQNNNTGLTNIIWNGIGKGSAVEVSSYVGVFGVAWYPAKVVDMNEDSALIIYDNNNEGTSPHEEWVPLKPEGGKAPQIRLSHPATLSKFKTRKRRRETTGNCSWVIGDHVDAWVNDRWREGVIAQNHEDNETKYVVQFSDAGGADSLVVDAWNLRPSLVWKDGQWIEWSRARERKSKLNKGDSPLEKRRRTDPPEAVYDKPFGGEVGGPSKDKITNNSKKPEEPRPLALSQTDMIFNIGKSVAENKTEPLAFKRPGLQKEGSKVVYGVPKHGKKKKFMEVSKHYVAGQSVKTSEDTAASRGAPSRGARHMVPPLPRPRDNTSKTDQRGRRVGETRSRGPLKPSKSQISSANTIPDKDSLSMPASNPVVFERNFAFMESTGASNTEKSTVDKNKTLFGPGPGIEDISVSEKQAASTVHTSKQDVPTTNRTKRKHVPSVDNRSIRKTSERTTDSTETQRTNSDSAEPRRSNRRIQPTSRLLEGLQSSLLVSKVPGEKGPRSHFRSATSRGRAHGHG